MQKKMGACSVLITTSLIHHYSRQMYDLRYSTTSSHALWSRHVQYIQSTISQDCDHGIVEGVEAECRLPMRSGNSQQLQVLRLDLSMLLFQMNKLTNHSTFIQKLICAYKCAFVLVSIGFAVLDSYRCNAAKCNFSLSTWTMFWICVLFSRIATELFIDCLLTAYAIAMGWARAHPPWAGPPGATKAKFSGLTGPKHALRQHTIDN